MSTRKASDVDSRYYTYPIRSADDLPADVRISKICEGLSNWSIHHRLPQDHI